MYNKENVIKMNVLVTGANGQLGNEMRILAKNSADKYVFTDVVDASEESIDMLKKLAGDDINTDTVHLDITKLNAIREIVKREKIDAIVNCAAWTNVDAAETAGEIVETLNATAPENLAIVMKEVGGLLIHISTDYVFGGDPYNTPCKEDQKGTPTGVYGLTKLHGEQKIQATGCNYVNLRTAWLYSEFGKNFVKTMLNLTAIKPQLKVVFDQVGTPTYAYDLAQAISTILDNYKKESLTVDHEHYAQNGVYHFSNEGVCSWYDFTKMIAEIAGNTACDIQPCHSDEFPSPVKRPAFSVLDKTKVKETFDTKVFYWTDSLRKCIKNLMKE
jgi:dTDP-4-dehydrorhamnose reductase